MSPFKEFLQPRPEEEKKEDPQLEEIRILIKDAGELLRGKIDTQSVRSIIFDKAVEIISETEDNPEQPERLDLLKGQLKEGIDKLDELPAKDKGDLEQFIDNLGKEEAEKLLEEKGLE